MFSLLFGTQTHIDSQHFGILFGRVLLNLKSLEKREYVYSCYISALCVWCIYAFRVKKGIWFFIFHNFFFFGCRKSVYSFFFVYSIVQTLEFWLKRCRYIYALFIFYRSFRYCSLWVFFIDWFDFCRNLLCNDRGNDLMSEILKRASWAAQFFMSCNWWNRIATLQIRFLLVFSGFFEWNTCYFLCCLFEDMQRISMQISTELNNLHSVKSWRMLF